MIYFFKELIKWFKNWKEPKYIKIHENTHEHFMDKRNMALQEYIVRHETKRRKAEHIEHAKMRR